MKEDLRIKSKTSLEKAGNIETEASVLFNGNKTTIPTLTPVQNDVRNHVQNHVQNRVQNRVQNDVEYRVQNHFLLNKNIANNNMSFLKITDLKKRDFIVNEFRKTRQNMQQNFLSERVGDLST